VVTVISKSDCHQQLVRKHTVKAIEHRDLEAFDLSSRLGTKAKPWEGIVYKEATAFDDRQIVPPMFARRGGTLPGSHNDEEKKTLSPMNENAEVKYTIKIKGRLDKHWSEWLGNLEISHDNQGNSLLSGNIVDQAALHGILEQIRDLGLTLISLTSQSIVEERR
jgi:hypothetical protein